MITKTSSFSDTSQQLETASGLQPVVSSCHPDPFVRAAATILEKDLSNQIPIEKIMGLADELSGKSNEKGALQSIEQNFPYFLPLPRGVFSGETAFDLTGIIHRAIPTKKSITDNNIRYCQQIAPSKDARRVHADNLTALYNNIFNVLVAEEHLSRSIANFTKTHFAFRKSRDALNLLPLEKIFVAEDGASLIENLIPSHLRFKDMHAFSFLIQAKGIIFLINNGNLAALKNALPYLQHSVLDSDEEIRIVAHKLLVLYEELVARQAHDEAERTIIEMLKSCHLFFEKDSSPAFHMPHVAPFLYKAAPFYLAFFKEFLIQEQSHPDRNLFFEKSIVWQKILEESGYREAQAKTMLLVSKTLRELQPDLLPKPEKFYAETFFRTFTFTDLLPDLEFSSEEEKIKPKKALAKKKKKNSRVVDKKEKEPIKETERVEPIFFPEPAFLKTLKSVTPPIKYSSRVMRWFKKNDTVPFEGYENEGFEDQILLHGFTRIVDKALHPTLGYAFETERGYGLVAQIHKDGKWRRGTIYYGVDKESGICFHRMFEERTVEQFTKKPLEELFEQTEKECKELFDAQALITESGFFEGDSFDYNEKDGTLLFTDSRLGMHIYIMKPFRG